jgi:hypothetical protein
MTSMVVFDFPTIASVDRPSRGRSRKRGLAKPHPLFLTTPICGNSEVGMAIKMHKVDDKNERWMLNYM